MTDRGNELWTPEPLFDQQTVFVLGGGPSLIGFDVERLRGRRVFVVNQSIYLAPWADALFFMDQHWFDANRAAVEAFGGLRITAARHSKAAAPDLLKRVTFTHGPEFVFGTGNLKFSRTSGHAAICLSIVMGAIKVVLLGFDMRIADGRSHFHDAYRNNADKLFRDDFLVHFTGWNDAARKCGVKIVNCTPGSALNEFEHRPLDEVLAEP